MPAHASKQDPLIGTLVGGRYGIDSRLGEGNMGTVYRATHVELGRKVAVKVLMAELVAAETAVDRFLREARICAAINHPNVVHIYDLGRLPDGRPYLAMELLKGQSLGDAMANRGPLAPSWVSWFVKQAAAGLSAVHRRGVIHRDIKPDNLFLTVDEEGEDQVKVLDFGLVGLGTAAPGERRLTRAGTISGTPEYMAPEAASSMTQDARADLYALAVTVFECLTGELPFDDPNPLAILTKKFSTKPPRLADKCSHPFSEELEDVIARGLSAEPEGRQSSVKEFAKEVMAAIATMETGAGAPQHAQTRVGSDSIPVPGPGARAAASKVRLRKPSPDATGASPAQQTGASAAQEAEPHSFWTSLRSRPRLMLAAVGICAAMIGVGLVAARGPLRALRHAHASWARRLRSRARTPPTARRLRAPALRLRPPPRTQWYRRSRRGERCPRAPKSPSRPGGPKRHVPLQRRPRLCWRRPCLPCPSSTALARPSTALPRPCRTRPPR